MPSEPIEPEPQFEKEPGFLKDLFSYLRQNRKWWLIPIVIVIVAMGALIALAGTSVAPFIYSFF